MKITMTFEVNDTDDLMKLTTFAGLDMIDGVAQAAVDAVDTDPTPAAPAAPTNAMAAGLTTQPMDGTVNAPAPAAAHDLTTLDANGHPWDSRIHAKTKTQTVKGVWKALKGLDKNHPGLRAFVEGELDALKGTATAPQAPGAPQPDVPAAPLAPPPPAPAAPVALDPAHQAVLDGINRVLIDTPAVTPGAFAHYGLADDLATDAALLAFLGLFGCDNIDAVKDAPEHWASLQQGLDYVWPAA